MMQNEYEIYIEKQKKDLTNQLIERLVNYRKKMGLTQQNIEELTGIKRPNVARLESGRTTPTLEVLIKIADSMDLELQVDFVEKRK